MPKIKAIFFDLDVILPDSREAIIPAYAYALCDAAAPHVPYQRKVNVYLL